MAFRKSHFSAGVYSRGRYTRSMRANAAWLLALIRRQWGIENEVHNVRDVSLWEDDSRVRTGLSLEVLAALRNTALHLLAGVEATSRAAAMRRFAAHADEALCLITG